MDPVLEHLLSEQAEGTLVRLDAGGFSLETIGAGPIHVVSAGRGWGIAGEGPAAGWVLSREAPDLGGGFRLDAAGVWLGRTLALAGHDEAAGPRHLLLADGRLFRIVLCRPRDACFELRGWEASGAYLIARPTEGGWKLSTTPAGDDLRKIGGYEAIEILFAAEIQQSDSGHEPETGGEGPGAT